MKDHAYPYAKTPEEKRLAARLEEKARTCEQQCYVTFTRFLDEAEEDCARRFLQATHPTNAMFYGGYPDAERKILLFLPDYLTEDDIPGSDDDPIAALRCVKSPTDTLSHRDYLGALMGLQIRRDCFGDILVGDHGADLLVLREIAPFLCLNFGRAGRKRLDVREIPLSGLIVPEPNITYLRDTVASMRLDAVCAALFRIPRAKAADAVRSGRVFVNGRNILRTDEETSPGDKITLRGMGRGEIDAVLGESRKGRIVLTLKRYQ